LDLSEQLFRRESGRMVAALTRIFGVHNLGLAEDVVQDAFQRALETWKVRGVPENPAAWLMTTAKNRAKDVLRRQRTARTFAPELGRLLETEWTMAPLVDEAFGASALRDEQLRMMFSCCHPRLGEEAQVALVLNVLCGFGASEIAGAFLAGRAAIEKRIARGKKTLASARRLFDLGDAEFAARLSAVRRALYLLFNEGYHGASPRAAVRPELCAEALRLTELLLEHPPAATPETHALAALMSLHAARLPARLDAAGDLHPLLEQDRARWDPELVARGLAWLERSAAGPELSAFHMEAAIAAAHASAPSVEATDWPSIVALYDRLLAIAPSPVVALNRAIALAERDGPERGLAELRAIADRGRLDRYPFYPAALGELELRLGNTGAAREHFARAHALARNPAERRFLATRVQACQSAGGPAGLSPRSAGDREGSAPRGGRTGGRREKRPPARAGRPRSPS
jgi:RNA polymerase sigma-70 factor (ECF subfamily)